MSDVFPCASLKISVNVIGKCDYKCNRKTTVLEIMFETGKRAVMGAIYPVFNNVNCKRQLLHKNWKLRINKRLSSICSSDGGYRS